MALTGARSMSEYISRSAKTTTSSDYLLLSNCPVANSNTLSFVSAIYVDGNAYTYDFFRIGSNINDPQVRLDVHGTGSINFRVDGATTGDALINITYAGNNTRNLWKTVFCTIDTVAKKAYIYCEGELLSNLSFTTESIKLLNEPVYINQQAPTSQASVYFTTDYIDFSQETNRNLFVNQLGYPRDLSKEIEAGTIPKPLIYLPFDDTTNLGKNLGTGGDFTVNGTVTAGSDFTI